MKGFFLTGTDTDAGKTTVASALAYLLSRATAGHCSYIKPVQTGCLRKDDGWFVPDVHAVAQLGSRARALFCFEPPCSPHLAAELAGEPLSCRELARAVAAAVPEGDLALVEGAGGCYVPLNEHETMMDLMLCLNLPAVLVVANRLGCINHAMLSIEALQARGIPVAGMILNRVRPFSDCDAGCGPWAGVGDENRILNDNETSLRRLGERVGVPLLASLPYMDNLADDAVLRSYAALLDEASQRLVQRVSSDSCPQQQDAPAAEGAEPVSSWCVPAGGETEESAREELAYDRRHLWHPYTSALSPLPVHEVVATHDNRIVLADGRELIDGMSSWWCAVHGYGNPALKAAMSRQLMTMSHVMFGGLTHRPAVELARRLLRLAPGFQHVFFADSGSVAVEVALKMAVQYQISLGRTKRHSFLTPCGGYHGDTQGAMSVCDPVTGMHTLFTGLLAKQYFMERPSCRFDEPFDDASLDDARRIIRERRDELCAVILEPVVQGAGGMWIYHPDYLAGLARLCREEDILLICDEIATGFGRTGTLFASERAGVTPDIMCVGKALTGGMMTGGAVLAQARVAEGIEKASPDQGGGVLMHGPTFMGNPLFCAAACQSLDLLLSTPWKERVARIEQGLKEGLEPCRGLPGVRDVRVLGAIGVVESEKPVNMAVLQDYFIGRGVWIRPFNHNVYLMPPFVTPPEDVAALCAAIRGCFEEGLC